MLRGLLPILLALAPQAGDAPTSDEAVLRIEGEAISADELALWLLEVEGEHQAVSFAKRSWAIEREARRRSIEAVDEAVAAEVDAAIRERVRGAFRGVREEWLAELERTRRTEDGIRRQKLVETRPEVLARAIAAIDRVVPEHLIRREWESRHGRNGRRYDLRMMRFRADVPGDADRQAWEKGREAAFRAARVRAEAARERVVRGEDFGLVAARESDDPETRDRRGVPPGGFRDAGWPGSFLDALERLGPGDLSQPIFARGGWWLVEVRGVETTPLESVRTSIEADLLARGPEPYEIGNVYDRAAEGLQIEVLPALHAPPAGEEFPSALEPVLRLDGEPVARGVYARWLYDAVGETWTDAFAEEWLVRRRARAAGIEVGEDEVAQRTAAYVAALVEEGYRGDRQAWIAYLELGGRTEAAFLRRISRRMRVDLLTEKLLLRERVVTPEALRARYEDEFGREGVRREVRMILCEIRVPDPPAGLTREELQALFDRASQEARARAEALADRARGGEDFAALARSSSDDLRTREAGGLLPGRFRPDRWSPEIADAVRALEPGRTTGAHRFGHDWLVLQLASERRVSFEEVKDELEREMREDPPTPMELAGYRNALGKSARIERPPVAKR